MRLVDKYINKRIVIHLGIISLFLYLPFIRKSVLDKSILETLIIELSNILLISAFYLNYYLLIPKYFLKKRYVLFITLNVLLLIFFYGVINYTDSENYKVNNNCYTINSNLKDLSLKRITFIEYAEFSLPLVIVVLIALSIILSKLRNLEKLRLVKIESEYLKSKNELLTYQIQPHFFFNTLHTIYELINESKKDAQKTILRLSQLMRYVLNVSEKEKVLILDELNFINDFIEIMRWRIDGSVLIEFKIQEYSKKKIVPLLLIILVENAFKHGIKGSLNDFIKLNYSEDENSIVFEVKNSVYPKSSLTKEGCGLKNLKKRLNLFYPNKFKMIIKETETSYYTYLKIFC